MNHEEGIEGTNGARMNFVSVNADTRTLRIDCNGGGEQAGQVVSVELTQEGFAQMLEVAARVLTYNLAP
jgi:hypothetical protein